VLALCALFVFMKYGSMSVDANDYLKNQNGGVFKGDMIGCLLVVIFVIIVERYCNRSDTKAVAQSTRLVSEGDRKFFEKDDFFRSTTNRSMTIKLKTMRTADMDLQGGEAQDFLS
jgi:hypothetical protein